MDKKCTSCGEIKSINLFFKRRKSKDGLTHKCKICCQIISRKNYLKHKDKRQQKHRDWLLKNREHCKNYSKNYYYKNLNVIKEKRTKYKKNYYKKNKQYVLDKTKEYLLNK